jgi:hypothetical protein
MHDQLAEAQHARLAQRNLPYTDRSHIEAMPALPKVPGMIADTDCEYLYWLTSRGYIGIGAVVELGPWLGRSTMHLAAGLRDAGHDNDLHCFDRFVWDEAQAAKATAKKHDLPLKPGDDFRPYFEQNIRPIYPKVRVYKQDLNDAVWDGAPIEILFLDAPKRLPEISATLATFGPALIPGLSVIAMQDYLHFPSYALAAVMSRLSDHLQVIHVTGGSTVTMSVQKPLDVGLAQPLNWDFTHWTRQEALDAWEQVLKPLPPRARESLEAGITMLLHDCGETEAACEIARNLRICARMRRRWEKWSFTSLYDRYRPIFDAAGFRRDASSEAWSAIDRTRWRKTKRRRLLRRAWRIPYLKSRSLGGRLLRWAHLRAPKEPVE